jgi:hypothetical protein
MEDSANNWHRGEDIAGQVEEISGRKVGGNCRAAIFAYFLF